MAASFSVQAQKLAGVECVMNGLSDEHYPQPSHMFVNA